MFTNSTSRALLTAVLCAAALSPVASAQERREGKPRLAPGVQIQRGSPIPASQRPALDMKSFGVQDSDGDIVSFSDFVRTDGGPVFTDYELGLRSGGVAEFGASMNMLPNGALVPLISVYYSDTSVAFDLELDVCEAYRDFGGSHVNCFASFQSTGTPGMTHDFIVVPDAYKTFLRRRDADGDGGLDLVSYEIIVRTNGMDEDDNVAIGAVRPLWFRQISPAPASPTFNDVPTSDPAFQYIEALVSSGVTAGCGGDNYCPDAPLTRRQMAVFLAKALGLHWPF